MSDIASRYCDDLHLETNDLEKPMSYIDILANTRVAVTKKADLSELFELRNLRSCWTI